MIYSEHHHFHKISSLIRLFNENGMRIFKVERIATHGGSIRVFACNINASHKDVSIKPFLIEENDLGLIVAKDILKKYNIVKIEKPIFKEYNDKIETLKKKLTTKLKDLKKKNKRVVGFGAPAKFCTLSHTFGIDDKLIEAVIDDSPLKQGLYTPGNHIPVVSSKYLEEHEIDYIVIFAWNFAESIMAKHKDFKGKWIVPIPEFKEI